MAWSPAFKKIYWSLAALGGLWAILLTSLTTPFLQRNALYAHKLHSAWWQDVNSPEKWGFLKNQIKPFNITTPDGEVLYAWHVLPIGLYRKYESRLVEDYDIAGEFSGSQAFDLLTRDPESRLVISFHGNAGHVGQGWRTDAYRAFAAGASDKIHVLAVDYRGFGLSTGSPSEQGLITDGIAAVDWVLNVANIPPERIALVGQSLGTAVTVAVAEHFATTKGIEFAGVGLIASFSDLPTLLATYSIGGVVPVLSPLVPYPRIKKWFESKIIDTWHSKDRLYNLVRSSRAINLVLIHARNDYDIHYSHSETLFVAAANATSEEGMTKQQIEGAKKTVDLGPQGTVSTWTAAAVDGLSKKIQHIYLRHGGHNRVTTYPAVSKAVLDLLRL